jgi:hypothetical protein
MTDSSTGGYLVASSSAPEDDDALVDFLQSVVVGITGLQGRWVRPRWQPEPPNLPPASVTWAAIGVTNRKSNPYPAVEHDPAGEGADTLVNYEYFTLDTSFYGPTANASATALRDGLAIAQNREQLFLAGMALVAVPTELTAAPTLMKERWLFRVDMPIRFTRQIMRTYPVLNLISAVGLVTGDSAAGNLTAPTSGNLTAPYFP